MCCSVVAGTTELLVRIPALMLGVLSSSRLLAVDSGEHDPVHGDLAIDNLPVSRYNCYNVNPLNWVSPMQALSPLIQAFRMGTSTVGLAGMSLWNLPYRSLAWASI